jgi:hypothetical protein
MTSADDRPIMDSVMDSAMDTGSDAGEPGERLGDGHLSDDESALLERLEDNPNPVVVADAPEDSPTAVRAAEHDTVLADDGPSPSGADPDDPTFRSGRPGSDH